MHFTEILCHYPENVDDHVLVTNVKTSYEIDESVIYTCQKGYKIADTAFGLSVTSVCLKTGTWSDPPPTCEGITQIALKKTKKRINY